MTRRRIIIALTVALAGATLGILTARRVFHHRQTPVWATVLTTPRALPDFELVDHRGHKFSRDNLGQQWTLVFFGFTNCPDICPTTLHTLSRVYGSLQDLGEATPAVVFVSVDPIRDTPERLAEYVSYFDRDFVGLSGEPTEIDRLTKELGVAVHVSGTGENYTVDHTTSLFLINPRGELQAVFGAPHDALRIADDYRVIVRG